MENQNFKVEDKFSTAIINSLPGLFYLIDEHRKLHRWNNNLEIVSGYSTQEISKINSDIFFSDDERPLIAAAMNDVFTKGHGNVEADFITKDGRRIPIYFSGVRYIEEGVPYMLGTGIDITERKGMEILLQNEKEQSKAIFNSVRDPIFLKDNEHRILFANPAFFNIFGLEEKQVIGKTLAENVPENEREHFLRIDRNVLDTGTPDIREEELTVAGHTHTIITKKSRFIDESGNKFLVGSINDITERKQADDAVRESEAELREAQRIGHLGSWYLNIENNEVVWTEELYQMYNFDSKLPPPPFTEHQKLFTADSWQRLSNAISKTNETGIPYELELETVREDGSNGWMWVRGEQARDAKGAIVGLRGVAQDITDRKKAENALHESKVLNQTLLDTSPDIIYIYDIIERKNIYSNQGILKILAYSIEEVQSMGEQLLPDLMHPDDFKSYLKDIIPRYQTAKDGESINHEYRMKHKNGNWIWLFTKESIFKREDDGSPKQIFGFTSDITERKKYDQEIEQLNTDLEQKIRERTLDLEKKNKVLEKMNQVFVGREIRMKELKEEIKVLKKRES